MKSFKSFFAGFNKNNDKYVVVDEPIHYKMKTGFKKTKDGYVIVDEPIHYKSKETIIKENVGNDELSSIVDANKKKNGSSNDLSDSLHKKQGSNIPKEHQDHILHYTLDSEKDPERTGSYSLNRSLIRGTPPHQMDRQDEKTHKAIMQHASPTGHEYHVFSGTRRNFEEISKHEKTKKFHFPAHTSTTHSINVAKSFAISKKDPDIGHFHMMHVHIKPKDKVLHTSKMSHYPHEHETVIPAGTNMKYSHTSDHKDSTDGKHYKVHHFEIE